jgi:hypothetical protein
MYARSPAGPITHWPEAPARGTLVKASPPSAGMLPTTALVALSMTATWPVSTRVT